MKVVFTYYPLMVRYSHACALLARLCRDAGVKAYIIPMDDMFISKTLNINPDYICVSYVTVHEYRKSLPYIFAIKETSTAEILAGGVYLKSGGTVVDGLFDMVCYGEAEDLCEYFLNGDTTVFDSKQIYSNIDTLPDYSCITGFEFVRGVPYFEHKKIIPYSTSRGCPYHCSFCLSVKQNKKICFKTTVKSDLDYLYEHFTPDLFYLMDELLPYYNNEWRTMFAGNKYSFFCYIRADIKEDELIFLINNGMVACAFGVESGDEDHRNRALNKGLTDQQINKTVEILNKNNIFFIPFYMVGTPGETLEIKQKTIDMADSLGGFPMIWEYENMSPDKNNMRCGPDHIPEVYHVLKETGGDPSIAESVCTNKHIIAMMPNKGSLFLATPITDNICSFHVYIKKEYRGMVGVESGKAALAWLKENSPYKTILGFAKEDNVRAYASNGMTKKCDIGDYAVYEF